MTMSSDSEYCDDDMTIAGYGYGHGHGDKRLGESLHHLSAKMRKISADEMQHYRTVDKAKPPFTFNMLVLLAVAALSDTPAAIELGGIQLKEIYAWIESNFLYYKTSTSRPDSWRSSVRHSLARCSAFKQERVPAINTKRRRRRGAPLRVWRLCKSHDYFKRLPCLGGAPGEFMSPIDTAGSDAGHNGRSLMEDAHAMLESRRNSNESSSPHEAPDFYGMAPSWSGSSVFAAHAWDSDLIGGSLEVKPSMQEIHSMAQHLRDSISSGSKSDASSYRQTYGNDPMTPQQVSSVHSPLAFPHNNGSMMNGARLPSVDDLLGMGPFAAAPPTTARTWTNHEIDHILENMAAVTGYPEHHGARAEMQMRDRTPLFASISFDSLIGDSGDYAPVQSDQLQHGYPGPMRMKQDRSHSWAPVRSMPYCYPANHQGMSF